MNRALAAFLAVIGLASAGAWLSHRYNQVQERASQAEATVASLRSQLDNAHGATETVTRYVDRIVTVKVKGDTIIREIPRYVTAHADASCTIPVGFVRLHDAAAAGLMLDPSLGNADAPATGIALSTVAGTVAGNYTDSLANADQLSALQATLRAQGVTIIGETTP